MGGWVKKGEGAKKYRLVVTKQSREDAEYSAGKIVIIIVMAACSA